MRSGMVGDSRSIVIFGSCGDDRLVRLRCLLLKCGIRNFASGRADECAHCELSTPSAGLFIVSRESVSSDEMATINAEAERLAVPVLYL